MSAGWRKDPVTGASTTIGSVGYSVNGLTYDSSTGTLYGSARNGGGLLTIDTATGAATYVGNTGYVAHHGDFNPDNNYYYGLNWGFPANGDIYVLDLVNGGAYIGTVSTGLSDLHTLAFVSGSVPEAGTTALLLGLSFAGFAAVARRRTQS